MTLILTSTPSENERDQSNGCVFLIFFFWIFIQHQSLDHPRHSHRRCGGRGPRRPRLPSPPPIRQVQEPGRWNYTGPFRFVSVPGEASRSDPWKAHDPGPQLFCFLLSDLGSESFFWLIVIVVLFYCCWNFICYPTWVLSVYALIKSNNWFNDLKIDFRLGNWSLEH